jgi:uncharacterized protein YxeA
MKKILIIILILILGFGIYWFFIRNKEEEMRCEEGFRFVPSSQSCEPVIKENKTGEIDFSQVKIKTVGNKEIALTREGETTKYSGKFEDDSNPTLREYVSLDTKQATKYFDDFIILPYVYNSGGTGQFVYLGLFEIKTNMHVDSIVLGDRIAVDSMVISGDKLKVNFKDRLLEESFAVEPSIPTQFVMQIVDKKIVPIMQIQNADYMDVEIKSVEVSSETLTIKGAMPGTWYFEANAHFRILDNAYQEIALGSIQALSDWMTTQKVPFEIKVPTGSLNYKGQATVIIEADDPKGDEGSAKTLEKMFIPVTLK